MTAEAGRQQPRLKPVQATTSGTPPAYAWYALGVLTLVYMVSSIDRHILTILANDIKVSLALSDAQLGSLYGLAFALFYAIFGIPLGRAADQWRRVRLIGIGLTFWSLMTAACGLASSFGQLAAARVCVGIGEASASPAAYSLLSDYFGEERRALALAVYSAGMFLGLSLSLPLGGWIVGWWDTSFANEASPFGLMGWQVAFVAVGIPGLALALWVLSLREPRSGDPDKSTAGYASFNFIRELATILPPLTIWSVSRYPGELRLNCGYLAFIALLSIAGVMATGDTMQWCCLGFASYAVMSWFQALKHSDPSTFALTMGTRPVALLILGGGTINLVASSLVFWTPSYVMRTFGMSADTAGVILGIPFGIGAATGCVLGGIASDVWKRRSARGRLYVCMLVSVLPAPLLFAMLHTRDLSIVLVINPLIAFASNFWLGSGLAALHDCVLPRMRSTASAILVLSASLIGMALGPYLVGKLSVASGSLRVGLSSLFLFMPVSFVILWASSRGIAQAELGKAERAFGAERLDMPRAAATSVDARESRGYSV